MDEDFRKEIEKLKRVENAKRRLKFRAIDLNSFILMCLISMEKWFSEFGEYSIEEYVEERILGDVDEMERFYRVVYLVPDDTVTLLDVGCGVGVFLDLLYKHRNIKGVGIDISEAKVNFARKHYHIIAEKGDAGSLRFDDSSFDVVTALEVLEHLPYGTFEKAIKEMARVARKTIIISVPYNEKRQFIKCPYCGATFNPNYHLRVFKEEMLNSLFPGFRIVKIEKVGEVFRIPFLLEKLPKILNFFGDSIIKTEFVCPVCGFKNPPSKNHGKNSQNAFLIKFLRFIWRLLPRPKQTRWIIVVYNRHTSL